MYIYPENLKAKPMLWLWLLRDIAIIGVAALISVMALVQGVGMAPLVGTVLYAFLSIQVDGSSSSWAFGRSCPTAWPCRAAAWCSS